MNSEMGIDDFSTKYKDKVAAFRAGGHDLSKRACACLYLLCACEDVTAPLSRQLVGASTYNQRGLDQAWDFQSEDKSINVAMRLLPNFEGCPKVKFRVFDKDDNPLSDGKLGSKPCCDGWQEMDFEEYVQGVGKIMDGNTVLFQYQRKDGEWVDLHLDDNCVPGEFLCAE